MISPAPQRALRDLQTDPLTIAFIGAVRIPTKTVQQMAADKEQHRQLAAAADQGNLT